MPLSPGVVLPKDMDSRQWSKWAKEQSITADANSVDSTILQDGSVIYAKIQDVTADTMLGRLSTTGTVQELTAAQIAGLLETTAWTFSAAVIFSSTVRFDGNVGFFSTTPTSQQANPASPTIATVAGTGDDSHINTNFMNVKTAIDAIRTILANYGLTA